MASELSANRYIDSLKNLISAMKHESLTDTLLNTRLELIKYVKNSDFDLFMELANQNIVLAQEKQKNWALIDIYMEIGEVLVTKGMFGGALNNLFKGLALAEHDVYKPYKGWINIAIGNAYNGMANYSKGIEFYNHAMNIFNETENDDGIGLAASNLGFNYRFLGDIVKAEYYLKMGIEYREKLGNPVELAFSRLNYHEFEISQSKFSKASIGLKELLSYLQNNLANGLNGFQAQETNKIIAGVYTLLANCEKHFGNYNNEFYYFEKAVNSYKTINDDLGLAIVFNLIGYRYFEMGQFLNAMKNADIALEHAKNSNILTEQVKSYNLKSIAYAELGNFEEALLFLRKQKEISDSTYNKAVVEAISNVDVLMKTLEKEKDNQILSMKIEQNRKIHFLIIAVSILVSILLAVIIIILFKRYRAEKRLGLELKEKNRQIQEQSYMFEKLNEELLQLNKSKDMFHSIIAHDLRGPVSTFTSLIRLLADSYDTLQKDEIKNIISMAHDSAEGNLKLLDNLLTWSRLQGGHLKINDSDFYIGDAIFEAVNSITNMAGMKGISIINSGIDHFKINADKDMIVSVIRNFCTNAIKFTEKGKKIEIGINKFDDYIEVWIIDQGIGIPRDKLNGLFEIDAEKQRKGTNNELGTGLGLNLCHEFIKLHNGEISVDSEVGTGSRFAFKIPLEYSCK